MEKEKIASIEEFEGVIDSLIERYNKLSDVLLVDEKPVFIVKAMTELIGAEQTGKSYTWWKLWFFDRVKHYSVLNPLDKSLEFAKKEVLTRARQDKFHFELKSRMEGYSYFAFELSLMPAGKEDDCQYCNAFIHTYKQVSRMGFWEQDFEDLSEEGCEIKIYKGMLSDEAQNIQVYPYAVFSSSFKQGFPGTAIVAVVGADDCANFEEMFKSSIMEGRLPYITFGKAKQEE